VTLREAVEATLIWPIPVEHRRSTLPPPAADADPHAWSEETLERLAEAAHAVDRALATQRLVAWLELVKAWNRKIDLTAAKSDEDLAELGVLDAVQIAGRIAFDGGGVVDVGSGFGAPGVAVAILRPDLEVKLVEPLGKRATFLRTVIGSLDLTARVEVMETKGEQVAVAGIAFDAAISRATMAPEAWLALGDRLAPDGDVVSLLAREPPPEHAGRQIAWRAEYATKAGAPRVAIGYRRSV
jgi:16S rRNA (guanine527-N7)-methyltransferase